MRQDEPAIRLRGLQAESTAYLINYLIFEQDLQADLPIKSKVNYAALCNLAHIVEAQSYRLCHQIIEPGWPSRGKGSRDE